MSDGIVMDQSHQVDSAVDRAQMRAMLESVQREVHDHTVSDRSAFDDIDEKLDRLIASGIRTAALVKIILALIVGSGAVAGWVANHYVSDIVEVELQKERAK